MRRRKKGVEHPEDEALGRSRGGLSTKVHLAVGRPRKRPERLIADKGYSSPSCRKVLRKRGIMHTIPERRDQRDQRTGHPGRKPSFDVNVYQRRNVVERCVNRLKQWRGIATRYEKRAVNYRAMVVIAALMDWLAS